VNFFLIKGIKHEDRNARLNTSTIHFPKIIKANDFLQAKVQDSSNFLCFASSFLKGFLKIKKLDLNELDIFTLFLIG